MKVFRAVGAIPLVASIADQFACSGCDHAPTGRDRFALCCGAPACEILIRLGAA